MSRVRHLYVHLPFCAHRCGYCDFVTAVGRRGLHAPYVEALLVELELERDLLAERLDTVFVGGGTPTFTEPAALQRLLAALPEAGELTIEANPETVTPQLADLLQDPRNRLTALAASDQPSRQIVDDLYWTALTRDPTEEERQSAIAYLDAATDRRQALEDLTWALVTSTDEYKYSDPWHYDTAGYLDLGKKFAEAAVELGKRL